MKTHGHDDALLTYAALLARFAHRFADRSGVLDARGLGEIEFEVLEQAALAVLDAAVANDDVATLRRFAHEVSRSRAGLEAPPISEPTTRATSTRRLAPDEAPPASVAAPEAGTTPHPDDVDPADLMATLSSEISRDR